MSGRNTTASTGDGKKGWVVNGAKAGAMFGSTSLANAANAPGIRDAALQASAEQAPVTGRDPTYELLLEQRLRIDRLDRLRADGPRGRAAHLRLVDEHAGIFELLECRIPEMQMENFALARQKVILDFEPIHRLQMSAQNRCRDNVSDLGKIVSTLFDRM